MSPNIYNRLAEEDFIVTDDINEAKRICAEKAEELSRTANTGLSWKVIYGKLNRDFGYLCSFSPSSEK